MINGDIDTLVKKSLQMTKNDFYNDLINSFEKKLILIGAGTNSEMHLNIKKKLKLFSGVAVFWKNEPMENKFITATAHGKFSKKKGEVKERFSAWSPLQRWTPNMISLKEGKVGISFNADIAIQEIFGIQLNKGSIMPTPKKKVKEVLDIDGEELEEITPSSQRVLLKNRLGFKDIEKKLSNSKKIYDEVLSFGDVAIDFFPIPEEDFYTPALLRDILLNKYKC